VAVTTGRSKVLRHMRLAAACVLAACGGGGAASDTVGTGGNPPEQPAPSPPAGAPSAGNVTVTTPGESFSPQVVNIATGGTVTWQFSGSRHNVTFGSLQPAGGNIPDTDSGNSASRVFATAGTYAYQCTRHAGMTGQVIVGSGAGSPPPSGEQPPTTGTLVRATSSGYNPERAEIAPGGTITWEFAAGADGIVFEDDAPPGGNIPESANGSRVSRTFPSEGDYDYHSLKDPDRKGRIRVR
jgi:plastocyanin